MGRPKIEDVKKRKAISISVSPEVNDAAEASGNKSKFFEDAAGIIIKLRAAAKDSDNEEAFVEDLKRLVMDKVQIRAVS